MHGTAHANATRETILLLQQLCWHCTALLLLLPPLRCVHCTALLLLLPPLRCVHLRRSAARHLLVIVVCGCIAGAALLGKDRQLHASRQSGQNARAAGGGGAGGRRVRSERAAGCRCRRRRLLPRPTSNAPRCQRIHQAANEAAALGVAAPDSRQQRQPPRLTCRCRRGPGACCNRLLRLLLVPAEGKDPMRPIRAQ